MADFVFNIAKGAFVEKFRDGAMPPNILSIFIFWRAILGDVISARNEFISLHIKGLFEIGGE
jgi:hypothetical protein